MRKYWGIAVAICLLIGAFWWGSSVLKERKNPLNQSDAFVYSDNGILNWFEITSRSGKVEGTLHKQKIVEEIGQVPFMEKNSYPLTGKTTEKGYEFKVNNGGKTITFDASFTGKYLKVKTQGIKDNKRYIPVDKAELNEYVKTLKQKLQVAIDQSEEKEKNRLRKFFSELDDVYGFLYTEKNGSFQLFLKIDENTHFGELGGSLRMMADTGNKSNQYEETRYTLNGITDGLMVLFITKVDGKETKLKGNFHGDATGFDLSFWTTDQKLSFQAVTKEEFNQSYDKFKAKAQAHTAP